MLHRVHPCVGQSRNCIDAVLVRTLSPEKLVLTLRELRGGLFHGICVHEELG